MSRFIPLVLALLFQLSSVTASPLAQENVPEPLKPWIEWVLHHEKNWQCPFFYHHFRQKNCRWPGRLSLNLTARQTSFTSDWQVFNSAWIELPGDDQYWPQNVRANNHLVTVIEKQGKPVVLLAPGQYQISGDFNGQPLPKSIAIPRSVGLIDLTINNKPVVNPVIKNNKLWLKPESTPKKSVKSPENTLELKVYRQIKDSIPLQIISRFELNIAGQSREIKLAHALLNQLIPISLDSSLPTRLEANGSLILQARPGHWVITLNARYPGKVDQIKFNIRDNQWSNAEVWSFQPQIKHRMVEITGVKPLDPHLTQMPKSWQKYPAYWVKQGDQLNFKLIRRGDPTPEPNQLTLKRQLWLDFDGQSYTISDTLTGNLTQGWRLNVLPEVTLGQVKLNHKNQLITQSTEGYQGIEVRTGQLHLQADSRLNQHRSQFHIVGWQQVFAQVSAELNIPPGWQLLAASGMDNNPDTWITRWSLLDLFLVLIASLAVARLWSVYWGMFALLTLALCWHENQAPHLIWLHLLAATALLKVIPTGRLQQLLQGYRYLCGLFLVIILIPFMISQVRIGLYPQLAKPTQAISSSSFSHDDEAMPTAAMISPKMMKMDQIMATGKNRRLSFLSSALPPMPAKKMTLQRIDPAANIQTGTGLPQWHWQTIHFTWNSSVDPQQQLKLWYLSPRQSMWVNFLRVVCVLLLFGLMFNVLIGRQIKRSFPFLTSVLILGLFIIPQPKAYAEFPPPELLKTLKNRLLQAPECLPACAQIPAMTIKINGQSLTIDFQLQTQQTVLIPLPARYPQWQPNQVKVDDRPATGVIRMANGQLWLGAKSGRHTVQLSGDVPSGETFVLPLQLKPHRLITKIVGWQLAGGGHNTPIDSQLIFSRNQPQQPKQQSKTTASADLPAFIQVERTLQLGLDWQVITRVKRVVNNHAAIALAIPLLTNESVITDHLNIKQHQVLINLLPQQTSRQWRSVLKKSAQIVLTAQQTDQWLERWKLEVSPIWHVENAGIPVIHQENRGLRLLEWHPWQGEQVILNITRPQAIKGQTLTIDRSQLKFKPGKRSMDTELSLSIRSSQGTQHTLTLPAQVNLQQVKINGIPQTIRQQNNQVILPIKPGQQDITLIWRKTQPQPILFTTPLVDLGINSINSHLNIKLPTDRWVIWVSGSQLGPAVLFWGVVIVIVLISFVLGKTKITPLKSWQWFLLLIGLSQIPVESAIWVIIWLMALGIRGKQPLDSRWGFNLLQITLVLLTLVSLALLFLAVQQGLLGSPDMQIAGNQSSAFNLNWYQDRNHHQLPTVTVVSVPLVSYRILMLLWALWLAVSLLNWLKWSWSCFSQQGLWKKELKKPGIMNRHPDNQVK